MGFSNFVIAKNFSELFFNIKTNNNFCLIAGGTYSDIDDIKKDKKIISLNYIPDLKKINFSKSSIYFGASACLYDIKNFIHTPYVLKSAINQMFPYYVQKSATLGGNLFVKENNFMSLLPLLNDLGAFVEIKKSNRSKLEQVDMFSLNQDEIVSFIKLKRNRYNIQHYKILGTYNSVQNVAISILGNTFHDVFLELFINLHFSNLPNLSISANQFLNKKLPLSIVDINSIITEINDLVDFKKWKNINSYYSFIEKEIKFLFSL